MSLLWHKILGHLNSREMTKLNNIPDGCLAHYQENNCMSYLKGKQLRSGFHENNPPRRAEGVLDLLHIDLCAPTETSSIGGAKWFLRVPDNHSQDIHY